MYGILVLCLLLRPMAFSIGNNATDVQPSNQLDEKHARDGLYIGCYPLECLKVGFHEVFLESTTPDSCTAACKEGRFRSAALYNRTECACSCEQRCHENLQPHPDVPHIDFCGLPCKNHSDMLCGGFTGASFYLVKLVSALDNNCIGHTNIGGTNGTKKRPDSDYNPFYFAAAISSAIIIVLIILSACLRKSDRRQIYSPHNHSRRWRDHAPSQENEQRPPNDPQTTSNQPRLPPRNISGTHQSSCVESTSQSQTRRDGEPAIAEDIRDTMPEMASNFYHILANEDGEETCSQCLSLATENAYAYADCRAYMNNFPCTAARMHSQADTFRCPKDNKEVEYEMVNNVLYAISKK